MDTANKQSNKAGPGSAGGSIPQDYLRRRRGRSQQVGQSVSRCSVCVGSVQVRLFLALFAHAAASSSSLAVTFICFQPEALLFNPTAENLLFSCSMKLKNKRCVCLHRKSVSSSSILNILTMTFTRVTQAVLLSALLGLITSLPVR